MLVKNIIFNFIKGEIVLAVSFVLAVISAFFVIPDVVYLSYIDFRTLAILLSLMLIMAGLQKLYVFRQIGDFDCLYGQSDFLQAIWSCGLCTASKILFAFYGYESSLPDLPDSASYADPVKDSFESLSDLEFCYPNFCQP